MFKSICSGTAALLLLAGMTASAADNMKIIGRKAFVRDEKNGSLKVIVQANKNAALPASEIAGTLAGRPIESIKIASLAAGEKKEIRIPVETHLAVGKYPIELTLSGKELKTEKLKAELLIGPRRPDQMIVLCCGYIPIPHKVIQDMGFTHGTGFWWHTHKFESNPYFDEMLFDGFGGIDKYSEYHLRTLRKEPFLRLKRNGQPYPQKSLNAADPEVQKRMYQLSESRGAELRDYPIIEGVQLFSEVRDSTLVSFDRHSKEAFQKFAGYPIPQEVEDKTGVNYTSLRKFPLSRVIPDNDPILTFYKWFWKDGDGWIPLTDVLDKAYRAGMKRPIWTYYEPAVRNPPIWGIGGNSDCIGHWVYATPDPINIGAVTSEIRAMVNGNPKQQMINMTQLIVYRSATAPVGMKVKPEPAWVKKYPKASYITIAPDALSIAVWTQISRLVDGILFHGLNSLIEPPRRWDGYRLTNPNTKDSLKAILVNVVRPLGPVLKRIPERKSEVAILESFASAMYANRTTWGQSGWPFQAHLAMLWGNLAPSVVYDETILRDGLDGLKVLVMPGCDVLTEKVYRAITEFQRKGGIIVGDRYTVPGITPDLTLKEYSRIGDPVKDKAALQKIGLDLRDRLAPFYEPYVRTSNPDIVTWVRSSRDADYLFTVNDKRTFGDYFGPYKKVMEKSVDNAGTIQICRASTGAVYDPVSHSEVPFEVKDGKTVIKAAYDAQNIGRLFLLLPEKIGSVQLEMASSAKKGKTVPLTVKMKYASGKTVQSIHPIRIEVRDAAGKLTDDSTWTALENGSRRWNISIPLNADSGDWKVTVSDLASGKKTEQVLTVR